jgi:hypothetical protein
MLYSFAQAIHQTHKPQRKPDVTEQNKAVADTTKVDTTKKAEKKAVKKAEKEAKKKAKKAQPES